jgi:hypothetical protein
VTRNYRFAAVASIVLGFGFGLPGVFGTAYFARHGEVWTFMGFPTYGHGPFEDAGVPTSTPLLLGFDAVCVAEVAIGALLWRHHRLGRRAALAVLAAELPFWIGFALPFGPAVGLVRTTLVLWSRSATRTDA